MTIATTVAIKHMIDDDPLLVVANRTSGTCIDNKDIYAYQSSS